jgi:hypothetical protein
MTPSTKVMLSPHELSIVADQEWILTKHQILEKISKILGSLSKDIQQHISDHSSFLRELSRGLPRISKGENYRQLPYLMLDYPALFGKEDVFALRTFFWWGNFFSINLQVSGKYRSFFRNDLVNLLMNKDHQFFICIHENPWEHHFEAKNFIPTEKLGETTLTNLLQSHPFVKITLKYGFENWDQLPASLSNGARALLNLISCPGDEKAL